MPQENKTPFATDEAIFHAFFFSDDANAFGRFAPLALAARCIEPKTAAWMSDFYKLKNTNYEETMDTINDIRKRAAALLAVDWHKSSASQSHIVDGGNTLMASIVENARLAERSYEIARKTTLSQNAAAPAYADELVLAGARYAKNAWTSFRELEARVPQPKRIFIRR